MLFILSLCALPIGAPNRSVLIGDVREAECTKNWIMSQIDAMFIVASIILAEEDPSFILLHISLSPCL
jgi:hypothetical protein